VTDPSRGVTGTSNHWKIDGPQTHGQFSIVHHPIAPCAQAAPLHCHHNEDEYSYVLIGSLGGLLGDDVVVAGLGRSARALRGTLLERA
jgi:uncharacterized cupin superfamily protein